ncbi:MAG: nuclear transport factor 2 family protein [Pseudomonadales bacterium]
MANEIETNKAVVMQFLEAFSESRFDDALALMADDGTWWVAGDTEISGTYSKPEFLELASGVAGGTRNGIRLSPTGITAEGSRVAVEALSDGETSDGKHYHNQYHFLFEFSQGKFIAVREYMDPKHVADVFGV